ncbi:non-histone protein [Tritrichomonas musculus]|uniref:Non-histone protein n=1 Tax=Tritrichomonas musculus TaxID=1915356 RepID=A0ABR2HJ60_9EUKA
MSFESTLDESFVLAPSVQIENEVEKISNKPVKRPHNAYNLFFIERKPIEREKHQKLSGNEISQLIGKIWTAMSEEEKRPYKDKAKIIQAQFKEENPNYHYQKSTEKPKRKKPLHQSNMNPSYNFNSPNVNINSQISLEVQLKNMFSSLGQQVVMRYLGQNKADIDGMNKNPQITMTETIENVINDIDAPVLNQ